MTHSDDCELLELVAAVVYIGIEYTVSLECSRVFRRASSMIFNHLSSDHPNALRVSLAHIVHNVDVLGVEKSRVRLRCCSLCIGALPLITVMHSVLKSGHSVVDVIDQTEGSTSSVVVT